MFNKQCFVKIDCGDFEFLGNFGEVWEMLGNVGTMFFSGKCFHLFSADLKNPIEKRKHLKPFLAKCFFLLSARSEKLKVKKHFEKIVF